MSNQELDNLFKNGLDDFGKKPKRDLWADIDAQLEQPKKRNPWMFMSIAASLLLLLAASYIIYQGTITQPNINSVAKTDDTIVTSPETIKAEEAESKIEPITEENGTDPELIVPVKPTKKEKSITNTIKAAEEIKPMLAQKEPIENEAKTPDTEDTSSIEKSIDISTSNNIAKIETTDATPAQEVASKQESKDDGQTLIFDISQFETAKNNVAANQDTEKKDNKLKQLLKIAKDIKEGESGLGEIRDAKNDLFALNSKKEQHGSK